MKGQRSATPNPNHKHPKSTKSITISSTFKQTKKTLISNIPKNLKSAKTLENPSSPQQSLNWVPLNLSKSELFLPLTLPTGQTFRWKQTGVFQFTGVVKSHLVSLKQLDNGNGDVVFFVHKSNDEFKAREVLNDFLNVGISLSEMWATFSASDLRFSEVASCLGEYLGTVEGFDFHKFPSLERLSLVSEDELRAAGFGYRAKYIVGTVKALQSKPGGGAEWLVSLRSLDLNEVIEALCTLPGVGPKVASCIALFSLDQHHAVPVDTHVWKIATRYLMPELATARLTPKLCIRVAEAFVSKFGKYAGWAQTVLFIAELPSQKALLPTNSETPQKQKSVRTKVKESEPNS
ncbi:hypothetical protein AQUCO_01400262v1 [Aquilegia coerulea]|uniref:DNA-(apurinic or apyrimidinic site) lyase n=1 Tax=Aquilegia coerulea TaxID=218851 RepID=A0A2G5DVH4_AQUCA|nr:hypothetical protein AQUCO_01400262v1 [Aquilegia coerulea]